MPYDDNTRLSGERHDAHEGSIAVKLISGEGHKVSPSFFECNELVEFLVASAAK